MLHSIKVNFRTGSPAFNITVVNQTSLPAYILAARKKGFSVLDSFSNPPVYQYIQINESAVGVDNYVSNVVYNFSVPKSWMSQHRVNSSSITLLKYQSGLWQSVPTYINGGDANYYNYSSVSDSLSTYAVSYTSQNASYPQQASGQSSTLTLNMQPGFNTYFWVVTPEISINTTNWTTLAKPQSGYSLGAGIKANATDIGYSSVLSSGTANSYVDPSSAGLVGLTLEGMGADLLFQNGQATADMVNGIKSSPQTLSYTVPSSNSFVVLSLGMNDGGNSAEPAPTASWPAGCTPQQNITAAYGQLASIVVCPSQPSGSESVTVTFGTSQGDGIGLVAYIFPQYSVTMDDNPTTGTITTGGSTYTNGQAAVLIGTGEVTANPPSGYILNNWTVSNSVNITISNYTSNPTNITVMGNDILTANYIIASQTSNFVESGLPSGTLWQATYRGLTQTSTTANIMFNTNPGNFVFNIPSVTIGTTIYSANTPSGYHLAGNALSLKFSGEPQLSIEFNPTFAGVSDNITANSIPNTDAIEILANGIVEKSASSGTITFNANALSAGIYNITAKDTSSGSQHTQILDIEPDPNNIANVVPITLVYPNVTISTKTTLSADLFCNNLLVKPANILITNGFSILCINNITNDGTIYTGNNVAGFNTGGAGGTKAVGSPGTSVPLSFGGSGAGGGGDDSGGTKAGGSGGSTLVAGGAGGGFNAAGSPGSTPSAPSVSVSNITSWYNSGIQQYFAGAGGGGGAAEGNGNTGGAGGGGSLGLFMEARNITPGNIIASGNPGGARTGTAGGGGGGGGGSLLFVYGDKYNPGNYTINGGAGSAGAGSDPGGAGGSGQVILYKYTLLESPIPVLPSPWQQLVPVNSLKYQPSEASTLNNIDFFYVNGTNIPSWLEANALNTATSSVYWLKFPKAFFGGGKITIYMGFAATSKTLFNLTDGEAPELSPTYGQYDSGANVFLVYANGTDNGILNLSADAHATQASVALTTGTGPAIAISTTASTNAIQWAGFKLGRIRYILNGFIYPTQTAQITGLGGEMELTPQGYIFGAGSGAGGTLASISRALTTTITTLASGGTAAANAWKYLQAIYNNGAMNATVGTAVLQKTQSVTATDNTFTGNSVGIAVSDTSAGSNLAYYEYFYAHSYPMGNTQPSATFGTIEFIPPPASGTCTISLSSSLISFGSIATMANTATSNLIVDTDSGSVASNIMVEGGNWISGSNSFLPENTLWNPTTSASYIGNAVQPIPNLVDTKIKITAGNTGNIYFGVGVPSAQAAGSYSQNIILENLC